MRAWEEVLKAGKPSAEAFKADSKKYGSDYVKLMLFERRMEYKLAKLGKKRAKILERRRQIAADNKELEAKIGRAAAIAVTAGMTQSRAGELAEYSQPHICDLMRLYGRRRG